MTPNTPAQLYMCLYPKKNFPVILKNGTKQSFDLPCGNCLECLQEKSREWSFRIALEASLYEENCEITLTYSETDGSLHKEDYQKFLKRLRKVISPKKIRYFLSGEYGSQRKRPHYHLIIFNWSPPDKVYFKNSRSGLKMYKSSMLEDLWSHGFILVQDFDKKGAKYCAKYLQKLQKPPDGKVPPFVAMSRGIGREAFDLKYFEEDKIYLQGEYIKLPRYYIKQIEKLGEDTMLYEELEVLKARRREKMELFKNDKIRFTKALTIDE